MTMTAKFDITKAGERGPTIGLNEILGYPGTAMAGNHHWTNAQVVRINRTIKDANVKRLHDDGQENTHVHLANFMALFNFACCLKTLGGIRIFQ